MDFVYDADGRYTLNGTAYNDLPSFLTATGGTFTRASVGTYYDAAGTLQTAANNSPRFDYDPVTHAAKGILIEESRTNIIANSYFENWPGAYPTLWNNPGNNITKITGVFGTNAMRITGPFTNGVNRIAVPMTVISPSTIYTMTVRLKLVSGSGTLSMAIDSWGGNAFSFSSASMTVGQYVTLSQTATSTAGTNSTGGLHTNNTSAVFDLDYIQLEKGAFPTSYIPTTTAAVTRAADNLTIPTVGWFSATNGTLNAEATSLVNGTGSQLLMSIGVDTSNMIGIRQRGIPDIIVMSRGTGSNDSTAFGVNLNTKNKFSTWYSDGLTGSYSSNGSVSSNAAVFGAGNGATYTTLGVGRFPNGTGQWNGPIQKVKYYPLRVSNTQLQLMTQ
jgi:hypothetical protein